MDLRPVALVEDDPADVELTQAMFEAAGLANPLIVLRDGADALDFLECRREHRLDHKRRSSCSTSACPRSPTSSCSPSPTARRMCAACRSSWSPARPRSRSGCAGTRPRRAYVRKPLTIEALRGPAALAGARCRLGDGIMFIERASAEAIGA